MDKIFLRELEIDVVIGIWEWERQVKQKVSIDLEIATDYSQRAIASAVRHELPTLEKYSTALYARALDLRGEWALAEDLVRDLLYGSAFARMVGLPVLGAIEARRGRNTAGPWIGKGWELASVAAEDQRLAPAAKAGN